MAGGNVDIIRTGEVGAVCRTEETKSILQYLQHTVAKDIFATLCVLLQDGKNNVLLAHTGQVFQPHTFAESDQLRNRRIL
ncbi:Uncharacterised protein [Salmonella enterica subsp. enterica serovar Bovismorbificans]|uniref:Uncharacterized protein n=1 Tax=Salmonella enterica subsp. enterica serovar Bovismorbificans TaxID=58097 RepID=A0A655CK36_SALET|nr:Uncharacterised protein [Salmonella enterica subsp. enterica serovar Bovismorbificans]